MQRFVIVVAFIIVFAVLIFGYFFQPAPKTLATPLPSNIAQEEKVLGFSGNNFFYADNLWLPADSVNARSQLTAPEITAKSAFVVEVNSGKVLYSKNPHLRLPVASTQKILTALVALELAKPDDIFQVSTTAASVGEDFMGISAGEKYSPLDLLYGLMLPSGNDAAAAIAENIGGSQERFVQLMNDKTRLIGAAHSQFANPSGLEGDGTNFSTAYDLALISYHGWQNPVFRQVVGTKYHEIPYSAEHKYLFLENQTNLLGTYDGVIGIKPGFTPSAGLCLVTAAVREGHLILAVILGSENRRDEMRALLDFSFTTLNQ